MEDLSMDDLTFKPLAPGDWDDLVQLFEAPGVQNGCWCMYWRVKRADFHTQYGEPNKQALRQIIEAGRVPGILAYHRGRPVGWCSVAPREEFPVLDRSPTLKRVDDEPVWSIVCFFVSEPYRRQGLNRALIQAALNYARENGASIVEAYPLAPESTNYPHYERYMGLVSTFERMGFEQAARRSPRRPILRAYLRERHA